MDAFISATDQNDHPQVDMNLRKHLQNLTDQLETAKNMDPAIYTDSNKRVFFLRKLRKNLQYFIYGSKRLAHPKKYLDIVFLLGTTANKKKNEVGFQMTYLRLYLISQPIRASAANTILKTLIDFLWNFEGFQMSELNKSYSLDQKRKHKDR